MHAAGPQGAPTAGQGGTPLPPDPPPALLATAVLLAGHAAVARAGEPPRARGGPRPHPAQLPHLSRELRPPEQGLCRLCLTLLNHQLQGPLGESVVVNFLVVLGIDSRGGGSTAGFNTPATYPPWSRSPSCL